MRGALLIILLLINCELRVRAEESLAPMTIVVFNSNLPESAELAKFYAQKRGIAGDHLIGLACPRDEEITRDDYDRTIAEPLREIFRDRNWWTFHNAPDGRRTVASSSMRIVALMKGMPLKIHAAENYPGDKTGEGAIGTRNEASVDSELATLAANRREISGVIMNPYFQSYRSIRDANESALLLVCRLDAPTAATVRHMITDAVETEKKGLWGRAYVDGAHNTAPGFEVGDRWLAETVEQFHKVGVPVVYEDTPALFPNGFPMSDCALYYGWYASGATGPFTDSDFRFTPGAIAVHIHSFSASSLRDANAAWVAPLLTKGAAASLGNVYEPYLQLSTHLDVLNDRLLHGFTFAESAYMATQVLSWMSVMVGDPLYRPYASWLKIDAPSANSEWSVYHDFALTNGARPAPEFRTLARQVASRAKNGVMIEDLGLMEARDGNFASATSHFQQARTLYTKRDDILRVVLEEADAWKNQDKPKRAVDLVRSVLKIVPDTPTATLLKKIEQDLASKPGGK
ncbi:MAG: TIGR03790 family protein [Chthoniobacterales bacterium]